MVLFLFSTVNLGSAAFMPVADQRASLLTAGEALQVKHCASPVVVFTVTLPEVAHQCPHVASSVGIVSPLYSAVPIHYIAPGRALEVAAVSVGSGGAIALQPWAMTSKVSRGPRHGFVLGQEPCAANRDPPTPGESRGVA